MDVEACVVGDMCDEHEKLVMLQTISRELGMQRAWTVVVVVVVVEAGCGCVGVRERTMDVGVGGERNGGKWRKPLCSYAR